jgi:hypothetical protein
VFPTGGATIWPQIEMYSTSGVVNGPAKQGLGWGFQILPYLEQAAVANIKQTSQIAQTFIPIYNCPSRRSATQYTPPDGGYLTDYAAAQPGVVENDADQQAGEFWGRADCNDYACVGKVKPNMQFLGVIVRTNWVIDPNATSPDRQTPPYPYAVPGLEPPVTIQRITDGTTNTFMISEKRLHPSNYLTGDWHDDRGWSDGWDPDTVRSTMFPVRQDVDNDASLPGDTLRRYGYCFGSAHSTGVNAVFADASVHGIAYDVDQTTFNRLGRREDGETIDLSQVY